MPSVPVPTGVHAFALERLLRAAGDPPVRVRLWDGRCLGAPAEEAVATLVVRDPEASWRLLADPELQLGELYVADRLEVEGDLVEFLCAVMKAQARPGWLHRVVPARWIERAMDTGLGQATRNAQHHYDVGNAFYQLWLDERMLYTCAYFPTPESSLEDAQLAKMDHVCRKLALRPGEEVVEAGCGWGALALHMARYYGVRVRAYNVSHAQIEWAREQAEKQGLADRVEFVEEDYRRIEGRYDAFVSVGMLEHVGLDHYETLGQVIDRALRPEGRGLVHTIGRSKPQRLNRWIRERVFPNAHPPTLGEMMRIFEPLDLAVLDVENLRLHYRLTAHHWRHRFERARETVEKLVGHVCTRTWGLYLAGTEASFATSLLQLYQVVFTRARNDAIPWTRAHLYTDEPVRLGTEV